MNYNSYRVFWKLPAMEAATDCTGMYISQGSRLEIILVSVQPQHLSPFSWNVNTNTLSGPGSYLPTGTSLPILSHLSTVLITE